MYKVKKCGHRRSIKIRFIKRRYPWKTRGSWVMKYHLSILMTKGFNFLINNHIELGSVFFPPLEENKNV